MPIQSGDVKLLKSAVMADVPEGGGAPTGTTISDGVSNAIFPDISELDRAGGRVNLRKSFVSVQTDDTDTYFGANVIVAEPPQDARVSVTLFSTEKTFDTREQAQVRIEAYLNKGPEWAGYLFENHIAGQRVIQLFQRVTDTIPNVGQTLVLIENEGLGTQKEQYIRATSISVVERTFTYNGDQDYKANVVTVDISDALRYDFTGSPATRTFTRATNGTKVRDTVVADAGTYVGVVPLTQAAAVGDFTIRGASIYTQLVPSAQTETPISFVPPYAAAGLPVPGAVAVSYTASHAWTTSIKFNLPGGCLPGSLSIQTDGITIFDDAGLLKTASGTVGTIDYANGILTLNSGTMSNAKAVTYTPAAQILRAPQSSEIPVTPESRSQSYVGTVNPIPQPGTLAISYMAQGRWYVLSDGGNGSLRVLTTTMTTFTFAVTGTPVSPATTTTNLSAKVAPLGWEKPFAGTGKAAYRSKNPQSPQNILLIDDSLKTPGYTTTWAKWANVGIVEDLSDIDTIVGAQAPYDPNNPTQNWKQVQAGQWGWYKWYHGRTSGYDNSGDSGGGNRNWVLIGDDRLFFLFCTNAAGYGWYGRSSYCFGDISGFKPGDNYCTVLCADDLYWSNSSSGYSSYPGQYNGYGLVSSLDFTGKVLLRNHTQLGNPVRFGLTSLNTNNGQQICGRGPTPFPNGADYSLWLLPTYVRQEDGHMRGILPGMLWMPQDRPYSDQTIVDNVIGLAGKRFLLVRTQYSSETEGAQIAFDITGPWR